MGVFNSLAQNAVKGVVPAGPQIGSNTEVNRLSPPEPPNANDESLATDNCSVF